MSTQDYVTQIWLLITTDSGANSGSDASLELQVGAPGLDVELDTSALQNGNQNLALGRSAQFTWTPGSKGTQHWAAPSFTAADITQLDLQIVGSNSDDAWLPASIWVITKSATSGLRLVSASPAWPGTQCFSTDATDCDGKARSYWLLPILPAPVPLPVPPIDTNAVQVGAVVGE